MFLIQGIFVYIKIIQEIYLRKTMKILILLFLAISFKFSAAQTVQDLNGYTFTGTATELTPPDVDRMPLYYNESIRFENGKIYSDVLKKFSINESDYTSEIDMRRMIAVKVVSFKSTGVGKMGGEDVSIEFSGEVYGDAKLSGELKIIYSNNNEVKFIIYATSE